MRKGEAIHTEPRRGRQRDGYFRRSQTDRQTAPSLGHAALCWPKMDLRRKSNSKTPGREKVNNWSRGAPSRCPDTHTPSMMLSVVYPVTVPVHLIHCELFSFMFSKCWFLFLPVKNVSFNSLCDYIIWLYFQMITFCFMNILNTLNIYN